MIIVQPAEAGFVCVAVTYSRQVIFYSTQLDPPNPLEKGGLS